MTATVKVIIGSVRTERKGKEIADWVMRRAKDYPGNLNFELVDLKKINLPFLDEPVPPRMSNAYVHEHTKRWSRIMLDADALIMVIPEYNHGYSPALKNAIDYLYEEWQGMPVALVGYGGNGATNAIKQLREVLHTIGMQPLADQITIGRIWEAVDENGDVKPENIRGDLQNIFNLLENAQSE